MIRLCRWSVRGGLVILTAVALCSLHEHVVSRAGENEGDKPDEHKWAVDRSLMLTPRSEPVPALKYRLFPLATELKEGNAVPIYLRLVHEQNDENQRKRREKPAEWNKLPLDQLPVAEARQFLDSGGVKGMVMNYLMKQLDLGARRKTADWNYTLDAGDPIGLLLPDAQAMRVYGGLLVLKARVEIAEKNYAAAAHTLQTGFAFSRHVSEGPFLVNSLVGISIASQLADVLLDWVSRDDAPNLYWALTALPRPVIDLRTQFELEYRMVELQFPVLADLKRERAPAEWDATLKRVRTELQRILGYDTSDKRAPLPGRTPMDPAAKSPELPEAKKYLVERMQVLADKVDAMPPAQVLLLHLFGVNDEYRDDMFKGTNLPVPQALPVLQAADKRLKSAPDTEATRIPRYLLPAIARVVIPSNRLERRIAALRTIEAVRLHAAAHDGQLPDKLADINEVPVPNDPGTEQPFEYRREKGTATLIGPPLNVPISDRASVPETGLRYRLTIKGKG